MLAEAPEQGPVMSAGLEPRSTRRVEALALHEKRFRPDYRPASVAPENRAIRPEARTRTTASIADAVAARENQIDEKLALPPAGRFEPVETSACRNTFFAEHVGHEVPVDRGDLVSRSPCPAYPV